MARYVVGDIQGCQASLEALLARVDFDPRRDQLLLCGDLVNRGPASLEVLRWVAAHEECVRFVLGNHDLHLLAVHAGLAEARGRDTLAGVLAAPDRDALVEQLARAPLVLRAGDALIVHAGLLPAWSVDEACELAAEVCAGLAAASTRRDVLDALRRPAPGESTWQPEVWDPGCTGRGRTALIVAALTRLRVCDAQGRMPRGFTGPPGEAPPGMSAWFEVPGRRSAGTPIVFGHWAALGLHRGADTLGLDSGCVWGGALSAVRLDDGELFSQPSLDA